MKGVNNPYCGTLPDFGNFRISGTETYDRYQGVEELLFEIIIRTLLC
jgi:hypothetical protein